ncbi:MAG: sulfatase [Myxococcota bacterium]|nr:sulfatase [Myxococcota bacterium]
MLKVSVSGSVLRGVALFLLLPLALLGCAGTSEPRMLLLITVDTLRADELGAYGSPHGLTPHLDRLATESVVFRAAYAAAPLTLPSVASLMTGRYPEALGIPHNEAAVPTSAVTLAEALAAAGWRTSAVIGNFVLRSSSGLSRGFAHFDDDFSQNEAGPRRMPERGAAATTDAALAQLDHLGAAADSPGFLWVHYQDPHGPYHPPAVWRERAVAAQGPGTEDPELPLGEDHWGHGSIPVYQQREGRRDASFYRAGYRGEVAYMDAEVGRLLAGLTERDLDAAAVVVFAADHGESLGESDVWFAHGTHLDDAQVRVPLMFRVPGRRAGEREDLASLVDVRPTLLALLLDEEPEPERPGRDLLAPGAETSASEPYLANLGVGGRARLGLVSEGFKLVATRRGEAFESRLHALGAEKVDLAPAAPELAARLRRRLSEVRGRVASGVPVTPQRLDEEDRAALRALGYVE